MPVFWNTVNICDVVFRLSNVKLPLRLPPVLAGECTVSVDPPALVSVPPTDGVVVNHAPDDTETTCHEVLDAPALVLTVTDTSPPFLLTVYNLRISASLIVNATGACLVVYVTLFPPFRLIVTVATCSASLCFNVSA